MTTPSSTMLPAPALPAGRPRLVVTGFMGTGKTSAGRRAARLLRMPFLDLDEEIEARAGTTVAEIFAREGEPGFRARERAAVNDAARLSGLVVATGGGAVLDPASFSAMAKDSIVVTLTCDEDEIVRRVGRGSGRPLLVGDPVAAVRTLLQDRAGAYAAAHPALDTSSSSPTEVAEQLAGRYRAGVEGGPMRIPIAGTRREYDVTIGRDSLGEVGAIVRTAAPEARAAAVVCDPAVLDGPATRTVEALARSGLRVAGPFDAPRGEDAKTAETVAGLWSHLLAEGIERSDVMVAVGGGAILDAAGLAAATYARGVALANVPTTLLAMVDAGLGGKVAIDHGGVKNSIGAFHDPVAVVVDPNVLDSLPDEHVRTGLAEIVKALTLAAPLGLRLVDGGREPPILDWLIEQAVRIKAGYVTADPEDRQLRHSLNLGHTFAHGIESASGYEVPHGAAVAIGLVAAARLGAAAGVTDPEVADRLRTLLASSGLPTEAPRGLDRQRVLGAMRLDKKRRSGRSVFVVPAEGGARLLEDLPDEAVGQALWGRAD